ncbi:DeoR family transcriptional regulator [Erwinia sp. OLTSP20]|uniref:DeoR/GlpR family DNA-binding transcription regulator n=1 Tax=unclassified Erwinia TaxID=2622719 RepID=UPI000C175E91|nr:MULTISPECIES: DNA-binding transcriptional regulator YciT [unclassified Erwinia]PIJ50424.1 DeoR family transcriptional regulator [Erwinia sp. OAMSP11]PIJ72495.1 DeoR family transcriptional regulator [Erwinia sp. OLSSP12]PIJ81733.1 DeoR family transcriptional regulator [Erwinia sp. OLCASP19]PIJ84326.1 DeoR family transcriptional regulator [Erwinia sp. OLMTSP26]PIJ86190.1 DeoR family transcriptional regulator [Erwinia sp. OLMDSP33]
MNARQRYIVELVNQRGNVSVAELAQLTGVSAVTVRQDLNELETGYYLKRVHGAAIATGDDDVGARMKDRFPLKQRLAAYAASLIQPGESVFIEGGSANALLARHLADKRDITIVTVSHYIARLLKDAACEVIVLGGLYQKSSESVVGPLTRSGIEQVHFQKAFIGIDGWHAESGFTGRDMLRCDIVNAVLAKGAENWVLTDSSKFGQIHPYVLAASMKLPQIITDDGLDSHYQAQLTQRHITFRLVKQTESPH